MPRRTVPFFLLAMLAVLSIAAITLSVRTDKAAHISPPSAHPGPANPYGAPSYGFGGYSLEFQRTTEIGARWRVPALNPQSSAGNATTWIAVEDDKRQFIQLGTTEDKRNGVALYGIFWSDVAVDFHPQQLLEVAPGDLISFKMVQVARGWRLSFDDLTQNTPETITVPYGRGSQFLTAQWIQEDPTVGGLSTHLPYPTIQPTTISDMTLNGVAPVLHVDDSQVLSTADGVYLIPTLPSKDRFTFQNAAGPALQYLRDIFALNVAEYPVRLDFFYKRSPRKTDLHRMLSELTTLRSDLMTQTWPASMTDAVNGDVQQLAIYIKFYQHFSVAPQPLTSQEMAQIGGMNEVEVPIVNHLRHLMGLPPV